MIFSLTSRYIEHFLVSRQTALGLRVIKTTAVLPFIDFESVLNNENIMFFEFSNKLQT